MTIFVKAAEASRIDDLVAVAVASTATAAVLDAAYHPLITPAAALTAADGGTVDGTYGAAEAAVINKNVTRIGEIEAALVAAGILEAGES